MGSETLRCRCDTHCGKNASNEGNPHRGNIVGLLALEATPMKWTIRIELTPDGNPPITYDIGTITRPIANLSPEQIGLTLEEASRGTLFSTI